MINYSIAMLGNPAKKQDPKKAYGVAQYTEKMTLSEFSEHISNHGSTYDAEDVEAILGKAVKCLREMLLAGKKVELGKLGEFYVTLHGKGTESAKDYNPATCVEKVNVVWDPGKLFENLKEDAAFNFVASRNEQEEAKRKAKAQKDDNGNTPPASGGDSPAQGGGGSSSSDASQGTQPGGGDTPQGGGDGE